MKPNAQRERPSEGHQYLQLKRKTPNISPLVIGLALFCSAVPIYYQYIKYSARSISPVANPSPPAGPLRRTQGSRSNGSREPNPAPNPVFETKESPANAQKERGTGKDAKGGKNECDLFSGEWVENPEGPYYTNETCRAIQEHQNCMKYGRPDRGFMKWRWKPNGCELPVFDPWQFLEIMRGKSLAFVGDSVARNHMQSLICLLSRVAFPADASDGSDENFKRWEYRDYDFNVSIFWSPYLVKSERTDPNDITKPFNLYLDESDESWTGRIVSFDYVVVSAGQWFFRPSMFYVNRTLVGCLYCRESDITHLSTTFGYGRAFRTSFRAINGLESYKGTTFVRTFVPSHFENGEWNEGGDCTRTRPFKREEVVWENYNIDMHDVQLEELRIAGREGRGSGKRFRLMDVTRAMVLRPDGHPGKYGRGAAQNVNWPSDCVHWCLPGPIDYWNDFLLELLKREN